MAIDGKGIGVALAATLWGGVAHAGEQFVDKDGIANFGYDVVAYHVDLAPAKGAAEFSATHNGATFWFASAANRELFTADPEKFAPLYDGHCAFALTRHKKLTVDPEAFSIVDPATFEIIETAGDGYEPGVGALYVNYSQSVNDQFNEDVAGNVAKADFAWKDCLELRPAATLRKRFRDLFGGRRPDNCPPGDG
ncbi:MAG: YHS domain-containing (seleno)protein [Parvularculaceae bacterium]